MVALTALATAAALLLAVTVSWRASRPVASPEVASAPSLVVAPMAREPARLGEDDPWGRASALPTGNRVARVRAPHPRPAADDPWPNRLPSLERSRPLAAEPLHRDQIDQDSIAVRPLSIARLEIESLDR